MVEVGRQNDSTKLADLLLVYSTDKPTDLLMSLFNWKDSRQGSEYWNKVFQFVEAQERK